jgi:hypothetical protein
MKKSTANGIAFLLTSLLVTLSYEYSRKHVLGGILILVWFLTNYIINEIKDK